MTMSSILSKKDAQQATKWQAPSMTSGTKGVTPQSRGTDLEDLKQKVYTQAYQEGLRNGEASGLQSVAEKLETLTSLINCLNQPLEALDGQVEHEVVHLAISIAHQLVRRELRSDPNQIVGVVRQAMQILPVASRDVRLHLHPKDAETVRELLAKPGQEFAWSIVEDPMLNRGGCQVTTQTSRIDARVESRIGKIFAELLGGDREYDG